MANSVQRYRKAGRRWVSVRGVGFDRKPSSLRNEPTRPNDLVCARFGVEDRWVGLRMSVSVWSMKAPSRLVMLAI
jgi:hypothetical protein